MNKMRLLSLSVLIASGLNTGCTVITFENGPIKEQNPHIEAWHHNFANGLFEGSEPVNIKDSCNESSWQSVTTSLTPQNALAAMFINSYTPGVELWNPKTVEISCQRSTITPPLAISDQSS